MNDPMQSLDDDLREALGLEEAAASGGSAPDLASVLEEVHAVLVRYVVFPTEAAADAVALWIAATHAQGAWEHATRLVVKSPVKRCGKTRLLEVIRELVHAPLVAGNASVAALVRSISEDDPPTLILDEADVVFRPRRGERSESAEDLRGILNNGYSRGWPYLRWDPKARARESCPTFAMAALGGIGDFPGTIEDRAVVIVMRRRAPSETVEQWRSRRVLPTLRGLRERLEAAVRVHLDDLAEADPEMPVEDRAADVWAPLVAVADTAGGAWPERARRAALALAATEEPEDATLGERLLVDLREIWGDEDALPTAQILGRLHSLEESPWADYHGRPLSARDLARLLRLYGVRSVNAKLRGTVLKCYRRADLEDPWSRYAPLSATSATPLPERGKAAATCGDGGSGSVADEDVAIRYHADQRGSSPGSAVAEVADERLDGDTGAEPVPFPTAEERVRPQEEVL